MRDVIRVEARNRTSGAVETLAFWSDDHDVTLPVLDPLTGATVQLACIGAGGLAEYGAIPATCDLSVEELSIHLDPNSPAIQLLRTYDVKFRPITVWSALFSVENRQIVEAAEVDFYGLIDNVEIRTPTENDEGAAVISCVSDAQEMSREEPAKRSDADQKKNRDPDDDFYQYANVAGKWEIFWGKEGGRHHGKDINFEPNPFRGRR